MAYGFLHITPQPLNLLCRLTETLCSVIYKYILQLLVFSMAHLAVVADLHINVMKAEK